MQNFSKLRHSPSPFEKGREQFLTRKLTNNPEKFWEIVSKFYQPKEDGESEFTTVLNLAADNNVLVYSKIWNELREV